MFKSNHERRMRYSIRKFSVGVASVLVASFFMGSVALVHPQIVPRSLSKLHLRVRQEKTKKLLLKIVKKQNQLEKL